ncbi:MAG: FTR1 family protein [Chitinophagales bacterium]|nr:FTR1 family protein [Chitinophagales bacterium]
MRIIFRQIVWIVLLCAAFKVQASDAEQARLLIHTFNYLGGDYSHAVNNGKVLDEEEYEEMQEFCETAEEQLKDLSTKWNADDAAVVKKLVDELVALVNAKAEASVVKAKATEAKLKVIAISGLKTYPTTYPNLDSGKKLFATECSKCHGSTGYGDGPEGAELNPKPRNFHDAERINEIDAAHVFNTIRLGVEGTGMKSFPQLTDDEVWDLAFYVLSLRYERVEADTTSTGKINLEVLSVKTDNQLKNELGFSLNQIAALRTQQPSENNDRFLQSAVKYLQKSLQSYSNSKNSEALRYLSLAYLEGIEPVENHLKASDPTLGDKLEQQITILRKLMENRAAVEQVSDSITATLKTISNANTVLKKTDYSFWMALVMSISILLREGLEAFLVVLVILSVIQATGLNAAQKWVHAGWIFALLCGFVLWVIADIYVPEIAQYMEATEGVVSLVAVCMLLYVGFWLHSKAEISKWKQFVSSKINSAIEHGSYKGLSVLSFFVVFREVFESVLFLTALNIESAGKQSSAIALGLIIALLAVVAFAFVVLRYSAKLPIPRLFKFSTLVMGLLAIVLAGKGIHSFQEVGWVSITGISFFKLDILGIYPTLESVAAQGLVVAIVLYMLNPFAKSK